MTKPTITLTLLIITFFIHSCKEVPQAISNEGDKLTLAIDSLGTEFIKDTLLTSVSIGIYNNGKKITAHYGELDENAANTPTDQTLYEIASVSKTFTGMLVAKAVLDGKLTIEDNVQEYLNGDYSNLAFQGEPVLIKHLLFHQAGFPQYLPKSIGDLMTAFTPDLPMKISAIESTYTKEAFIEDIKNIQLTVRPGTNYNYSNADVELMTHILENIYNMTYEEMVVKYIATPAGMDHTKVRLTEKEEKLLANGYGMNRIPVPHFSNSLSGADGGLKSNTLDLVNYMKLLLDNNNLLSVESKKVLLDLEDYGAGYFWPIRQKTPDGTYYNHHGGAFGTQNWFYIYPKYNIGISVITNQSDLETADKLQDLVLDLLEQLKR